MLLTEDPAHAFVPYPPVEVPSAPDGPLAGLTFGVKDLFDVAGYPTGCGSPHMLALSGVKTRHAACVQILLDAGARFIGKTHTDELAFSLSGQNAHFGTPRNGAAPDRIPGGSSSGSASAVSNGLCDFAIGTDTGGSVRGPASHCGLFGLRPSHGRISLEGAHDLAPTFDTGGFFARDGETFAAVAATLLGPDAEPLPERPRLLLAADAFAMLEVPVRAALATLIPPIETLLGEAELIEASHSGFDPLFWAFRRIQGRQAWAINGRMIERYAPPLGPGVAERFQYGEAVTDDDVADAETCRAQFTARITELLGRDGIMLLPTMPDIAPLLTDSDASLNTYRNQALKLLCLSGLSGLPQVSIPLATRLGAPLGLSLIGPAGSDRELVRLAVWLLDEVGEPPP
jgi:amidase